MKDKLLNKVEQPVLLVSDTDYATYAQKLDENRVVELVCSGMWLKINHAKLKNDEYLILPTQYLDFWLYDLVKDINHDCENFNLVVPDSSVAYSICKENLDLKTREDMFKSRRWEAKPVHINLILPMGCKMFSLFDDNHNTLKQHYKDLDKNNPQNYSEIGHFSKVVGICYRNSFDKIKKEDNKDVYDEIGGFTWNNVTVSVDKTKYYYIGAIYEYGDKKDKRPLSEILEEKMFK